MTYKFQLIPIYYFGKDVVKDNLAKELKNHKVKKAFLPYGGGSIKHNGLYNEIVAACKQTKVKLIEFQGIEPNPKDTTLDKAVAIARKEKVDLIIAAGGGSVIDAAKVIAAVTTNPQFKNVWSYVEDNRRISKPALPIFTAVTLAATGSESNESSVITNAKTKTKKGTATDSAMPLVCFEDPKFQLTLSKWQTACGIFDIMSHLMEQFFDPNINFDWTSEYILANMRTCYNNAKVLMRNLTNYEARANMLWTSSWALNNLAKFHTTGGDWTTHRLEHGVSGLWDVEHGAGLALICPTYLHYMVDIKKNKLFKDYCLRMGKSVFGSNDMKGFFTSLNAFIKLLGLPTKYTDFEQITKVTDDDIKFLNVHFNKQTDNKKKDVGKYVFSHIEK